ncbi:LysE family translocator [Nissabacter sp. SGAir0207]|uniref:LysE family translocator n=1 Tax=Nissabacter sp. SGAir0207 TaxID=2126321 RepID=UPI0010CCF153|nr:LysE family translocator [Nissabacter sp. SGAir0207]QCR35864.1 lysine transporter LysE [Nissabacter sp. SGAir0207]
MNMTLLSAYIFSVMMLLLTPGPVVALITGTAARYGYRSAFATAVGTNGASLILIALATLMLRGVVSLSPVWLSFLGLAGSVYIGYSALQNLCSTPQPGAMESGTDTQRRGSFLRGFATGLSNPKDILFFVSFFPQFIAVTQDFTTSVLTLCLVWVIFDFAILTLYILTVRKWMSARHGRKIEITSSLFLLTVAGCGSVYNVFELTHSLHLWGI